MRKLKNLVAATFRLHESMSELVAAAFRLRILEKEVMKMKLRNLVLLVVVGVCMLAVSVFSAVPLRINYQGRYAENGTPVTGNRTFKFRIVSSDGQTEYWEKDNVTINLQNGLFNYVLEPTGVNWPGIEPYFEVTVAGNLLLPRERINASAYAIYASSASYAFTALQSNENSTLQSGFTLFINGEISTTGEAVTISTNVVVEGKVSILETGSSPTYYTIVKGGDQGGNITYTLPTSGGGANEVLKTDGSGNLSWTSAGTGNVTAGSNITDNRVVRGAGGAYGVQESSVTIDDTGHVFPYSDSAQNLGTSTTYWANTYTDKLYLNPTAYLDGANPGIVNVYPASMLRVLDATDPEFRITETGTGNNRSLLLRSSTTDSKNYIISTFGAVSAWPMVLRMVNTDALTVGISGQVNLGLETTASSAGQLGLSRLCLNSTAYLDGGIAGTTSVTGNVLLNLGSRYQITTSVGTAAYYASGGGLDNWMYITDSAGTIRWWIGKAGLHHYLNIPGDTASDYFYIRNASSANQYIFGATGIFTPASDSTGSLGSSSIYWQNTYTDRLYLNPTAYLDGATAGTTTIAGGTNAAYILSLSDITTGGNYANGIIVNIRYTAGGVRDIINAQSNSVERFTLNATGGASFNPATYEPLTAGQVSMDRLYLNSTAYLDGAAGGSTTISGDLQFSDAVFDVYANTSDGSDNARLNLAAGGGPGGTHTRGARVVLTGNEYVGVANFQGTALIYAGDPGTAGTYDGMVLFMTGNSAIRWKIDRTGHLLPETDSTFNIGNSSTYVSNTYTDRLYLNSTAYLDGATAGRVKLAGATSDEEFFIATSNTGNQFSILSLGSRTNDSLEVPAARIKGYMTNGTPGSQAGQLRLYSYSGGAEQLALTIDTDKSATFEGEVLAGTIHAFVFLLPDAQSVGTNKLHAQMIIPFNCTILKARANAGVAPTGDDLIFDINYDSDGGPDGEGTTIWATQANRLKIVAGQNTGTTTTFNTTSLVAGGTLTIDVDWVGSTEAGQNVCVDLVVRKTASY